MNTTRDDEGNQPASASMQQPLGRRVVSVRASSTDSRAAAAASQDSRAELDQQVELLITAASDRHQGSGASTAADVLRRVIAALPVEMQEPWAAEAASGQAFTQLLSQAAIGDPAAVRAADALAELAPADVAAADQLVAVVLNAAGIADRPATTRANDQADALADFYSRRRDLSMEEALALFGRSVDTFIASGPVLPSRLETPEEKRAWVLAQQHVLTRDGRGNDWRDIGLEWWHPLNNGNRDLLYQDPDTASPWKLHIRATSHEQVTLLAARLVPVVVERGLNIKLAGSLLLESGDPIQAGKGAVVYLPRRDTLAEDAAAVIEAVSGLDLDGHIPGDVALAPGIGMRRDMVVDPGKDIGSYNTGFYSPADPAFRAPDHERACAELRTIFASSKVDRKDVLEQARNPFGSSFLGFTQSHDGMLDSARSARAMSAYALASRQGHDKAACVRAADVAWAVPESRPGFIASVASAPDLLEDAWRDSAAHASWGSDWARIAEAAMASDPDVNLSESAASWHAIASSTEPAAWENLHAQGLPPEVLVYARGKGWSASQVRPGDTDIFELHHLVKSGQRPVAPSRPPRAESPAMSR